MATVLPPSKSLKAADAGWEIANSSLIKRRAFWCLLALALAFFGLLARLYFLQIVRGSAFVAQARHNRLRPVTLPAPRGLITDRNGVVLATSRSQHNVAVVPGLLPSRRRQSEQRARLLSTLAFLLNTDPQAIEATLDEALAKQARPYDAVPIAENVDLATVARIEENKPRLSGAVLVTDELRRTYPYGSLAAHILGYSGVVNERDLERAKTQGESLGFGDRVGKSGLERQYDALLRGKHGAQIFEVDAQNRPLHQREAIAAQPGATLHLSVDLKLQLAAEKALSEARNNGAVAAIDPRNGEVLALASRPNFNPNIFELPRAQFSAAYKNLVANPGHPLLDRAVVSRFPPGSTFKMISASAGLQKGVISPNWSVTCNGGFTLGGGRRFGCWKVHGAGVNLSKALAQSCDVYFYQMALKLGDPESVGPDYLAQTARQFGLGSATHIDLPVDEAGLIPDPAWRARINKNNPDLARWYPGNTLNMSIGQGDVLATPLQMALAAGALGNGGTLWQPHLLRKSTRQGQNPKITPLTGHKIGIDAGNLQLVREGLRKVVTDGTGRACNLPQVAVAGKTGSAEDANNALPPLVVDLLRALRQAHHRHRRPGRKLRSRLGKRPAHRPLHLGSALPGANADADTSTVGFSPAQLSTS